MKFTRDKVIEMAGAAIDKDKAHAYSGFWTLTEDELTRLCTLAADAALEAVAVECENEPERQRDDGVYAADQVACVEAIRAMKEHQ